MIKLVACDLDGTLFNSNITVSDENVAAIKAAQKSGIEFLVATGRSPEQSRKVIKDFGINTGFININGALVFDANGKLQVKNPLPTAKAKQVADILDRHHIYYELVTSDLIFSKDISQRVVNLARALTALNPRLSFKKAVATAAGSNAMLSMTYVDSFTDLLNDPKLEVMKIISFDGHGPEAFVEAKKEIMALGDVAVTSSSPANIEINLNDESMIRDAGTGVAMGNAVPAIKKLAQVQTKTNDENGVAYILKQFISENAKE